MNQTFSNNQRAFCLFIGFTLPLIEMYTLTPSRYTHYLSHLFLFNCALNSTAVTMHRLTAAIANDEEKRLTLMSALNNLNTSIESIRWMSSLECCYETQ